jgi:dolichol-phosphate mannosyltransferase
VLVIDDNSPDGTGKWVDEQAASEPRLRAMHRAGKLGLGTATMAGMRYAIERGYAVAVNMDADWSHDPAVLPALVGALDDGRSPRVDVAIGSRYVPGGGTVNWPWRRRMMSRGVNWLARWTLGITPRDCSGAFRAYRTATLGRIDLGAIVSTGYSFQEEILFRLAQSGARFEEIPITFRDRTRGQSKIRLGDAVTALWVFARLGLGRLTGR